MNTSKAIKTGFVVLFVLIIGNGCRDNLESYTLMESPKVIGAFPLKERWKKDFDGDVKAMALGSDLLVAGIIEKDRAVIQAFDVSTGSSRWKSEIPGTGMGIDLTISENVVYAICASKLIALNLDSGEELFQTDIGASIVDEIVAVSDEHVFVVQISEGVYVYDKLTGNLSWQLSLGRGNVDVFWDAERDLVYIVHGESVRAVNEQDGALAWESRIGPHGAVGYQDEVLYYSASNVKDGAKTDVHAFRIDTKSELWKTELGRDVDCITMQDDGLIAVTTETIAMVDPKLGDKVWEYYIPLGVYCPPIFAGGVIYLKDGSNNQLIAMQQVDGRLSLLGNLDFEDPGGLGYQIPNDNLLYSNDPFPYLAFYLRNLLYVFN
jgi:outer membrane protein assembly factor BamB